MIEIKQQDLATLNASLNHIFEEDKQEKEDLKIDTETLKNIKNILSSSQMRDLLSKINDEKYYKDFDYKELADINELFEILHTNVKKIKESVDINIFFKEGYNLDIKKLREKFQKKKLYKQFPNFNFEKLKELYKFPPKKIPTYYNPELEILIDSFVYRKYLVGIIQMVFNHMDLLICAVGNEGSGKSTKISQDMLMVHRILKDLGIIDYPFDIKELWFNTLPKFREAEDKYFNEPFRIVGLDEGNELNRQDWKDEEVKTFFQRLRRERYNRRIKFICLPVLGELITNIVLSRMNFISDMLNKNELRTATLYKGDYDFYIIPRGNSIYSPHHKKEISQSQIKEKLYVNLKDKAYLKGIPKDILIKKCKCNGVWGFEEKIYEKELKETNKTYTVNKGITFGITELFMFYKSHVTAKKIGIKKNDVRYASLAKLINRVNTFFYTDPDMMIKHEAMYEKKIADREENQK